MVRHSAALSVFIAVALSACATSSVTAFKDPAFSSTAFGRVGVFAVGMNLDAAVEVERQVCEKLAPTPCEQGKQVVPPTRQFTGEEVQQMLGARGIDAVLIVGLISDQADTRYAGSVANASTYSTTTASTAGNVSVYGNTGWYNGTTNASTTTTGSATSTPIYNYSRLAFGDLGLYDAATGAIAWRGQVKISGQGMLNVTDRAFISSATSGIAKELKASGFFPQPASKR